ncbi:class I SAM-dependent methyltransferase [Bacillus ndiopicus]|uniref:class I SAM-dependent methyltransferase n=1 Tax=Bacillus ndiopicus TaxID=1347368 RepID=UPI000AE512D2|nr:class I SAM-dependent methyltransferase [Bacillus ndiopicus]
MRTNNMDLNKFSQAYDNDFPYALDNELILNWYPKRVIEKTSMGKSLLELGIGHGYTSISFSKHFSRHVVIDGSEEIISKFKQNHDTSQIEIIYSYFEDFETTEKFDVIVMGFILEHVDNPDMILNKFKEFLKPNGKVFIAVPNSDCLNKRIGLEAGLISDMKELTTADLALGHQRIYDVDSLKNLCVKCGFIIKSIEGVFLKPITTSQIKELKLSEEILNAMLVVGVNYPELSAAILMEISLNN